MIELIIAITLYCGSLNSLEYYKRKCVRELRQCVREKQASPLGRDDQYLDECLDKVKLK